MPVLTMVRGDTPTIDHGAIKRGSAVENLTGATLFFTAKKKLSDSYASALIKKSTGALGGVTITSAAGGLCSTQLLESDTATLTARTVLYYDLELRPAAGGVFTVETGQLIVDLDSTDTPGAAGIPPPVAPAPTDGTFIQWQTSLTPDAYSASLWSLPVTAPVSADVGKPLIVSAAAAAAFVSGFYYTGSASGLNGLDTRAPASVTTTDATVTTVATFTPPANCVVRVVAHAVAHEPATGATCARVRTATFRVDSAVVTQVGTTVDGDGGSEQDAGASTWAVTIVASGGNVLVRVQGEAGKTISWQPLVQFERLDV